jgi:hypothetical protein
MKVSIVTPSYNEQKYYRTDCQGSSQSAEDADLEYRLEDYPVLLEPVLLGKADAVFGSRLMAGATTAFFSGRWSPTNF